MKINRKELISRHNPIIKQLETDSPLTVGNGEFAFTVDPTGMQTFYNLYDENYMPLCTMAQWGWHCASLGGVNSSYTLDDIVMTEYDYEDRKIHFPVDKKEGNEEAYMWLRHNPHRPNLARIAFVANGKQLNPDQVTNIYQELHLYEGKLESHFKIDGKSCFVTTLCDGQTDILGFEIETEHDDLSVRVDFPYGSHNMAGSDWTRNDDHSTVINRLAGNGNQIQCNRVMDDFTYDVTIKSNCKLNFEQMEKHRIDLQPASKNWNFTVTFTKGGAPTEVFHFEKLLENNKMYWETFWNKVGVVDFKGSADVRASELERRIILSQYLLTIQSSGSLPPQETGLTCNSWHGKFHLEMHLWHSAWFPLWNQPELLERSLSWYEEILDKATYNASKNGFKGARWPKQVADDGIDSPSPIAPLLLWQQSHIIYMLELIYQKDKTEIFQRKYWSLVKETADFMCDYLSWNAKTSCYDIVAPVIPAQEEHDPRVVKNPTFELEYWRFSLDIAIKWADNLGEDFSNWAEIMSKMAKSPQKDGLYLAHENCPDTFEAFNRDHPSMLGAYGLIPSLLDEVVMSQTVDKVLECWEFETMWGWDFALMAMTAIRIGNPELAIDILLMDTPKNEYVISGNNYQRGRTDLPLYLPGNGSLLLAIALMVAGYVGCNVNQPGIPKNGKWQVEFENITPFPY